MKDTKKLNMKELEKVNGGKALAEAYVFGQTEASSIHIWNQANLDLPDTTMGSAPSEPRQKHTIGFPI